LAARHGHSSDCLNQRRANDVVPVRVTGGFGGWKYAVHPEDLDQVMRTWAESMDTGKEFNLQFRFINKAGDAHWFLTRAISMCDEDGKIQRWIGTSTDIHEQQEMAHKLIITKDKLNNANELLHQKNKRLKHINKDLDNFVYSATHDLRSPVSNLELLLKFLHAEAMQLNSSEKFIDYFNLVFKSMDKLKVVLDDLTEVVKVDDQDGNIQKLSFVEIIEEVKLSLQNEIQNSRSEIVIHFNVSEVNFSRKNLRSVFYNILSNAIKYRENNSALVMNIKTEKDDQFTLLSISDNGIGIREKDIEKVFLPFQRINYDIEGTGIGMWIMKRIIENNGGKIAIESEVNKGTTFKIYFKN